MSNSGVVLLFPKEVRRAFDHICWVTLGQTPDATALQQALHLQLTGGRPLPEKLLGSHTETLKVLKELALAKQKRGRGVLLVLDDVWSEDDEKMVNFFFKSSK